MRRRMREIKALEDVCPFCGKKTGEATIAIAPSTILEAKDKAIGNPCEKCQKELKIGHIGFISPSGEGVIMQKDIGLGIMKHLGVADLHAEDAMTVVLVGQDFWNRQFKSIVDRRVRLKKRRKKK